MRVLIEVLHIVAGLLAAALIAVAAAWSYPRATDDIWLVAYACMIAVVAMGVGPVRRAFEIDKARLKEMPARD
jgi:type IV secretory pathway TrbD component